MHRFILALLALSGLYSTAAPIYTFELLPFDGHISGAPGATIGWGYRIENHSDYYLLPISVDADLFASALPFALFDFPIVEPRGSITREFIPDTSGLYQLT